MIEKLKSDLKEAQLARDELKTSVLRLLLSEIKNLEIQKGVDYILSEDEVIWVIQKELKKRQEAALGFRSGAREDSAIKEETEADILSKYLPAQLSDAELSQIIDTVMTETNASSISDMGKVIGGVVSKVKGQASGDRISKMARLRLNV